ncbi:A-kinase anchoring protein 7 isoform X1 [Xenopus tropicalis]|uniref:A-kinase anchoring protein 7 isoform X1 n=1 Tax=Xenopus tropicalis TaxID=8364 RepID=A0A8J1JKA2_XENTR|nr:A-kinase anchoring protein 7 isoform X1 [Xenopus tropicalis]
MAQCVSSAHHNFLSGNKTTMLFVRRALQIAASCWNQPITPVIRTPDKKIKKKRKRKGIEENEDGGENKKQKRANYFVSLPILNPKILGDISTFQDAVLKKEPKLSRAMVPKGSFHLTLFVTHLANEEEVSLAASSFLEIKRPVEEILDGNPLILSFRGVTEFRNEVVFGKITEGDSQATLKKISEAIERIFKEKGIIAFGYKGFVPHLTFIKLSRSPKLRRQGLKKINASLYEDFKEHNFGEELMARLDLCSMLKKRQENGYYHTEASIYFDSAANHDSGDSEEIAKDSSTAIVAGKLTQSEDHTKGDSVFHSESVTSTSSESSGSSSKNSLVGGMDGNLAGGSESINNNDNMNLKQFSAHIKAPVVQGRQNQGEAKSSFTKKKTFSVMPLNDGSSPKQKNKMKKKTLCGQVKDTSQINTRQTTTLDLKETSLVELVSLQKQRMQVEQEKREQNENNMSLLLDRLTMIQEHQRYTNKNLNGLNKKLSFISKQLGQIVQLLQPSAGISTSSLSQPLEATPIDKGSEEQSTIKEVKHLEDT